MIVVMTNTTRPTITTTTTTRMTTLTNNHRRTTTTMMISSSFPYYGGCIFVKCYMVLVVLLLYVAVLQHSLFVVVESFQHVIVSIAMEQEAQPFIDHMNLKYVPHFFPPHTPFRAYTGYAATTSTDSEADSTTTTTGTQLTVVTNGKDTIYGTGVDNVGTVPAALITYLTLEKIIMQQQQQQNQQQHDLNNIIDTPLKNNKKNKNSILVVNAGTAGGFQRMNATIGDVYLTTRVVYHDRRIPIPVFVPYGIGQLDLCNHDTTTTTEKKKLSDDDDDNSKSSSSTLLSYNLLQNMAETYQYKLGTCSTGNSLDTTPMDDEIMKENHVTIKDMELGAIAYVCIGMYEIPFLGVKVITDIIDGIHPTQEEFLRHLHRASNQLQKALPDIIQYLVNLQQHEEEQHQETTRTNDNDIDNKKKKNDEL